MFHRLLPSLRRSRALFALALCAWLLLAGMAWAAGGCCDDMRPAPAKAMQMDGHAGMHGMHDAQPQAPHTHGHAAPDCTCAHAPARLDGVAIVAAAHPSPERLGAPRGSEAAPQRPAKPPLRPPSA
ncbi:hypothetical protein [Dyella sp.]|uniref:hypothetical protein n=1 Tax=Dyella sp. TaxID=1869338 RepID=UPI003217A54B